MKTKLTKWVRQAGAAVLIGGAAAFAAGCAVESGGVAYSSGPYATYYDYTYYPGVDVYYYPSGRVYYWNDRGHWVSGRHLPPRYVLDESRVEHYRSHSREPWKERRYYYPD